MTSDDDDVESTMAAVLDLWLKKRTEISMYD